MEIFKNKIEDLSSKDLLDMFADNVARNHYDPCGDMTEPKFSEQECKKEILNRLKSYGDPE
jgi:hypothetical protein